MHTVNVDCDLSALDHILLKSMQKFKYFQRVHLLFPTTIYYDQFNRKLMTLLECFGSLRENCSTQRKRTHMGRTYRLYADVILVFKARTPALQGNNSNR